MTNQKRTDDELPNPHDPEIMANARAFLNITDPDIRADIQKTVEELSPVIDEVAESVKRECDD